MEITLKYSAQIKQAAGTAYETLSVKGPCTASEILKQVAASHEALQSMLYESKETIRPSLLLFVGEDQVTGEHMLEDGDVLTLMSPIAGGLNGKNGTGLQE